jgi:hypothetical protein
MTFFSEDEERDLRALAQSQMDQLSAGLLNDLSETAMLSMDYGRAAQALYEKLVDNGIGHTGAVATLVSLLIEEYGNGPKP